MMNNIRDYLIQKHGGVDLRTITVSENAVAVSVPSPPGEQLNIRKGMVEALAFLGKYKVVENSQWTDPAGLHWRPTTSSGASIAYMGNFGNFSLVETPVTFTLDIPNIKLFQELFDSIEREWEQRNKKIGKPVGTTPSFNLANQPAKTTRKKKIPSSKILFPKGTRWDQLTFLFVSEDTVTISGAGESFSKTFADIGFRNYRMNDNYPCDAWHMLMLFGKHKGEISWKGYVNAQTNSKTELKKQVSQIRRRLEENFNIAGDPFEPSRKNKSYKTKFRVLISSDGLNENEPQDKDSDSYKEMSNRYENSPAVKKAKRYEANQPFKNE
ncbi:MAG: hypothetical protein WC081_00005 [Candidatus Ratteibacteria bacterium]